MQDPLEAWAHPNMTGRASVGVEVVDKERFEKKSHEYMLEKRHDITTEATTMPTVDVTSGFIEYDITGGRLRLYGQATGGYLKEVAENEEAFSYSLQDTASLFLLHKIATSEKRVDVANLEEVIENGLGWLRVALLIRGGLLDVVGSEVRATERAIRELEMISAYSKLKSQ